VCARPAAEHENPPFIRALLQLFSAASSLPIARAGGRQMATTRATRTAVVVTSHPERHAFDIVMDSPDIDVALFETAASAYTRIKEVMPSVVIVYLSFDRATEFLLLTMLKLDRETATIPVWTFADVHDARHIELFDFGQAGASCCSSNYFQRT
jgi:hypothetical protein